MRFFNTAGPCRPEIHFMLSAAQRLPLVLRMIEQQTYFVLHAPRQTGKTTAMRALAHELTASGRYVAAVLSMEVGAVFSDDPGSAEAAILDAWRDATAGQLPVELQPPPWPEAAAGRRIGATLRTWSEQASRPLVVFLDEIDALQDAALISVLRQLRDGYANRPERFPWSLALCGLRDPSAGSGQAVRDYKVASGGSQRLHTSSPFNIKVESITLKNFTAQEVSELYSQHTTEHGQPFTPEAQAHAHYLTQGQPWMVNRLAYIAVEDLVPDRSQPITAEHIDQAKEEMIQRRDTHLDSLAEKLREPRVRRVLETILTGATEPESLPTDDVIYVRDLGLISTVGQLRIANPIYQEVIPRELTFTTQLTIAQNPAWYVAAGGKLDMHKLLDAFQHFFRENSEAWIERFDYKEAGPQLLMQAFLQRIVNGGGSIGREYALGRKRTDLLVRWRIPGGEQRVVIELKVVMGGVERAIADGLPQTWEYMDKSSAEQGHLVIFDRTPNKPWGEKLFVRQMEYNGAMLTVWGM